MALSNSFVAVIDNIISTLEGNGDLTTFCRSTFKKRLSTLKRLIPREAVTLEMYPLIMITRPEVKNNGYALSRSADIVHLVKLYCAIRIGDSSSSSKLYLDKLIQFEEYVDQALILDTTRGVAGVQTRIGDSRNDEGAQPPEYFIEKSILITQRINPAAR